MEIRSFNRSSITIRLLIIGLLILVLMIPSAMITSLVNEREQRKRSAILEITSKWAQAQTIGGPVLTIPYEELVKTEDGKFRTNTGFIKLLPRALEINGDIKPEIRYRGIYKAVLYNAKLMLKGDFSFAKLENLNIPFHNIHWKEAFMALQIPDMRGIKDNITLSWDGQDYFFEPGIKTGTDLFESGVSVNLPLNDTTMMKNKNAFELNLNLNGSETLYFLPLGQKTSVKLTSPWISPSFDGAFLPEEREITKNGFTATWKVLDLNRNFPQQWTEKTNSANLTASAFGVNLFSPVDEYQKTTRAIKYLVMFVGLTFLLFFLIEIFNKKRIHPIQYLLIGVSLCIFYVLLLSLSEHINFEFAYLIAVLSISSLITAYVGTTFKGKMITFVTAVLLLILYGFMYVLLQNQDYALLLGSIGIFIILAVVMYLSRNIDWYKIELNG